MVGLAPQTKANEIMGQLKQLEQKPEAIDWDFAVVKREIDSLKRIDAVSYYMLCGMLNCIKGNATGCIAEHERSVNLAPTDIVVLVNFAISLRKLGRYSDSLNLIEKASSLEPSNIRLISEALTSTLVSGRFSVMEKLIDRASRATNKASDEISQVANYRAFRHLIEHFKLSESIFVKLGSIVEELIQKLGKNISGSAVMHHKVADVPYIAIEFSLPLSGPQLAEVNNGFMERFFADDSLEDAWGKVVYNFSRSA